MNVALQTRHPEWSASGAQSKDPVPFQNDTGESIEYREGHA